VIRCDGGSFVDISFAVTVHRLINIEVNISLNIKE
jgi:hypothetical protein